ncbi:MAG: SRPBCC domain-containing protein [Saprospiraceae bacterium]|nr:SRPBCC domain-containing protein [Saprospiraceae bacterium]
MERKTQVHAEAGKQELRITRQFGLPVELLFQAHTVPELVAQWMNTNVLRLEAKRHGSWQFETTDAEGRVVFRANGVFHEFEPNRKITRTFEMENAPFAVQLEFLEFEALSADTSRLNMHLIFKSVALRDQLLQMPFAAGLSMAHDRLEETAGRLLPPNS